MPKHALMEEDKSILLNYVLSKLAEAPQIVKSHIEEDGKKLKYRRAYFKIKKYASEFLRGKKQGNRLIILPGLRGVGKTTILFQIYDYLASTKKIDRDQILYFSTDELKAYLNKRILDVIDVFIREIHKTTPVFIDKELFILIDEAHFDKTWSEAAKIFFDQNKKIFMIFTGSSALNFELNVDVARRAKKEIIYPMNFSEYVKGLV